MTEILNLAWTGNLPEAEHYSRFNIMIRERAGRRLWHNFLSQKQASDEFQLTPSAFELVGNLMIGVLNECERHSDAVIAR
jgi:hypothetical protein